MHMHIYMRSFLWVSAWAYPCAPARAPEPRPTPAHSPWLSPPVCACWKTCLLAINSELFYLYRYIYMHICTHMHGARPKNGARPSETRAAARALRGRGRGERRCLLLLPGYGLRRPALVARVVSSPPAARQTAGAWPPLA